MANTLYYGDNLHILRRYIPAESVDLIYLDPPFNSERVYSVLFKDDDASESDAQVRAFDDFWRWDEATEAHYAELTGESAEVPERFVNLLVALRSSLGDSNLMAYLVMMAVRLVELHRVLKPTGSLYLHCDPTASHYLKLLMDVIFGAENFLSEVVWRRTGTHSSARRWGPVHDVLLFYAKRAGDHTWNRPYVPLDEEHVRRHYTNVDAQGRPYTHGELTAPGTRNGRSGAVWHGFDVTALGRHWCTTVEKLDVLDKQGRIYWPQDGGWPRLIRYQEESKGRAVGDVWEDIAPLNMKAKERLGYPTQKPVALLERIIEASSNEGDVVLDPFCGCGTSIDAAQRLKRTWLGIDITHLAISIIRRRLASLPGAKFEVRGEPADAAGARTLAKDDPYQFQWWALDRIGARPSGSFVGREGKKGSDRGIDGVIRFRDEKDGPPQRAIVQVKGGHHVAPSMIRDLRGTLEREGAAIGVFLTLHEPTDEMRREARLAGSWKSKTWNRSYPRIQILTVAQVFEGEAVQFPGQDVTLRAVPRAPKAEPEQLALLERPAPQKKRHGPVRATTVPQAPAAAAVRKAR